MASEGTGGMKGGTQGRAGCPEAARVRSAVHLFLSEEISSSSSLSLPRELKSHLAACGACAAEARALDPTLLFAPMSVASPSSFTFDDAEARRVAADVLAEVRRRSRVGAPPATLFPARRAPSRRFLQAAALVLLAVGLVGAEGIRLVRREWARPASNEALVPTPDTSVEAREVREALKARSVRPLIQDLKNPGARVYEFAAVSPKEPSVVFIADPHADL